MGAGVLQVTVIGDISARATEPACSFRGARVRCWAARVRHEWPAGVLLLGVLLAYTVRLDQLSVRGEESRRAQIAIEMMRSGDWVVPRQQGQPLLSRPPLQNWFIAGVTRWRGSTDLRAIRLPSVLAVLLTTALIYAYARTFLSRLGAASAGLSYAAALQVLQLGRSGETEALFTLFVSGSLLGWHLAIVRGWNLLLVWCGAGLCVGCGVLTKGPQAPVYFLASGGAFLLFRGEWRQFLRPAPWLGLVVAALVVLTWQWPFQQRLGWVGVWEIYAGDVTMRFEDRRLLTMLGHAASYPGQIVACLFPWSMWAVALFDRRVRQAVPRRSQVAFMLVALAVSFPTCWLTPGAKPRYFMPMYPCLAVLLGAVVEAVSVRCALLTASQISPKRETRIVPWIVQGGCWLMLVTGATTVAVVWWPRMGLIGTAAAASSLAISAVLATVLWGWRTAGEGNDRQLVTALAAWGMWAAVWQVGVMGDVAAGRSETTAAQVAKLRAEVPGAGALWSFGPAHHVFAYLYGRPIKQLAWPASCDAVPGEVEFFCFEDSTDFRPQPLPFAWERLAVVSCERNRLPRPEMKMVVGRRLDVPAGRSATRPTTSGAEGRR